MAIETPLLHQPPLVRLTKNPNYPNVSPISPEWTGNSVGANVLLAPINIGTIKTIVLPLQISPSL